MHWKSFLILGLTLPACVLFATTALADTDAERCAKGEGEGAIAACTEVIGVGQGENIGWAYFNRARAYFGMGLYGSAIDDLGAVLKANPKDVQALENRALAFQAMGQYPRAVDDLDKLVDLEPQQAKWFRKRCTVRVASGEDLGDALKDCNQAIKLGDVSALDPRCLLGYRAAQYKAAIEDCTAALARNPRLASALYVRGLAKRKSGDETGGDADIASAKSLDPEIAATYADLGVR